MISTRTEHAQQWAERMNVVLFIISKKTDKKWKICFQNKSVLLLRENLYLLFICFHWECIRRRFVQLLQ